MRHAQFALLMSTIWYVFGYEVVAVGWLLWAGYIVFMGRGRKDMPRD